MTGIAYDMPGATSTAFLPVPAKYSASWQSYKQDTHGQPGTERIPAPRGNGGPGAHGTIWLGGGPSRSQAMPPEWYPTLYYQQQLPAPDLFPAGASYGGPSIYSDNQMPVPAVGWGGTSFNLPGARMGSIMLQGTLLQGPGPGAMRGDGGVMTGREPVIQPFNVWSWRTWRQRRGRPVPPNA